MTVSSVASVLLAAVPYQFIRLNSRQQRQRRMKLANGGSTSNETETDTTDSEFNFNIVEFFTDTTKWIEYDVLSKDFSGMLNVPSGWESASFGFLSALSSQLYSDVLCLYTTFGSESTRNAVRNRSFEGWTSLYFVSSLSTTAALFGVYDFLRYPVSLFLREVITGGLDSCLGSQDYNVLTLQIFN